MKILIVDDSGFARAMVKRYIMEIVKDGTTIIEADSGEKAIELFKQEAPDIIFLDLLMPGINGETVLKTIRASNNSVFVVILTSNFQKPVEQRLMGLGANLFISKSITVEKMKSVFTAYSERST